MKINLVFSLYLCKRAFSEWGGRPVMHIKSYFRKHPYSHNSKQAQTCIKVYEMAFKTHFASIIWCISKWNRIFYEKQMLDETSSYLLVIYWSGCKFAVDCEGLFVWIWRLKVYLPHHLNCPSGHTSFQICHYLLLLAWPIIYYCFRSNSI